jgi:hypothetical protein
MHRVAESNFSVFEHVKRVDIPVESTCSIKSNSVLPTFSKSLITFICVYFRMFSALEKC